MNIDISKNVIVVTGSTRGIGSKIITKLAAEGAGLVLNYRDNDKNAEEFYDTVKKINCNVILVKADVTNKSDVNFLYKKALAKFEKIDILINNAGTCDDDYTQFMSFEQWDKVIRTNLYSAFLCSRQFSKNMIKNHKGKIINIASLKGELGSEGQCNYSASKAGMIGLTKSLAKEMGRANISVNAICPGFIQTDMNRNNISKVECAKRMSTLTNEHTLEDLLNFVTILCSDCIVGVSGRVFNLDSRIM